MNYPDLIEGELKKFSPLETDKRIDSGVVVGAGDSYAAALVVESKTRRKAIALDPYEAINLNVDKPYVIVSISGKTKTNIELAKVKKREGRKVIAITANASSPLAQNSDEIIIVPYKADTALPGTLSFLLALSALYSLFNLELTEDYKRAKPIMLKEQPFFIGQGENYGIAYYATLKMNEIFCEPANYEKLELFPHSPIFSTRKRQIVVLSSKDEREKRLKELINFTDVSLTECHDAFCNAFSIIHSIAERMRKENWNRICFLDDKQILNISSEMIY